MSSADPIDVQSALEGAEYPAGKDDLMGTARANGADDDVVATLAQLPAGVTYRDVAAVSDDLADVER